MPLITVLGNGGIFWILLSVTFMLIPKYRKAGFSMAIALLMGLLICNLSLKPLVARIRPYDFQLQNFGKSIPLLIAAPHDYSFPSGHTIASFEAAVALLIRDRKLGMGALALAVLIAFSRLYLYVHYPTDVLASVVLGTLLAFIGTGIVNMINNFIQKRKTA
jgi:undecaprenyl-diphosphatase